MEGVGRLPNVEGKESWRVEEFFSLKCRHFLPSGNDYSIPIFQKILGREGIIFEGARGLKLLQGNVPPLERRRLFVADIRRCV